MGASRLFRRHEGRRSRYAGLAHVELGRHRRPSGLGSEVRTYQPVVTEETSGCQDMRRADGDLSRVRHCRLADSSDTAWAGLKRHGHADRSRLRREISGVTHAMALAGGSGEIRALQNHDPPLATLNRMGIL